MKCKTLLTASLAVFLLVGLSGIGAAANNGGDLTEDQAGQVEVGSVEDPEDESMGLGELFGSQQDATVQGWIWYNDDDDWATPDGELFGSQQDATVQGWIWNVDDDEVTPDGVEHLDEI